MILLPLHSKNMNYQIVNQLNETQIYELVELYKHEFWSQYCRVRQI